MPGDCSELPHAMVQAAPSHVLPLPASLSGVDPTATELKGFSRWPLPIGFSPLLAHPQPQFQLDPHQLALIDKKAKRILKKLDFKPEN